MIEGALLGALGGLMGGQAAYHRSLQQQGCLRPDLWSQQAMMQAQAQSMNLFGIAALAAAGAGTGRHYYRLDRRREHRERKWMATTKAGYKAKQTVEVLGWVALGIVLIGGVILPVGMRLYTSLWTWALGGG